MLGEASLDDVTVTRQAKLPVGWTDVVSGTGASEGAWGVALVEGNIVRYRFTQEMVDSQTALTAFPVYWGSSGDDGRPIDRSAQVQKDKKAAAMALLDAWLREANLGLDQGQQRHLEEVKKALDEQRLPGQKLFP